jgi:bifunctional non-homologous end joining protein LigD
MLVCQVKFTERTRDDRLRQPVFLGLREDKSVSEVVWEKAS